MKNIYLNKILVFLLTIGSTNALATDDLFAEMHDAIADSDAKDNGTYIPTFDHFDKLNFNDGNTEELFQKNSSLIAGASKKNVSDLVFQVCGPTKSSYAESSGKGLFLVYCEGKAPVTHSLPQGLDEKEKALNAGIIDLRTSYDSRSANNGANYVSNGMISALEIYAKSPSLTRVIPQASSSKSTKSTIRVKANNSVSTGSTDGPIITNIPSSGSALVNKAQEGSTSGVTNTTVNSTGTDNAAALVVNEAATINNGLKSANEIVIAKGIEPLIFAAPVETEVVAISKERFLKQLCRDAISKRVMKKFKKCMKSVEEDYREVPDIQRKLALYDLEKEFDQKMVDELAAKCNQFGKGTKARKSCRKNVKKDVNDAQEAAEKATIARYDIIKRKMESIDEGIDGELNKLVLEACGDSPVRHEFDASREYSKARRKFNSCKKPVEDKFLTSKDGEASKKIEEVNTTDEEIAQVLKACGERPMLFGVSKYEKCVDKISLDNINRAIAQAQEEAAVKIIPKAVEVEVVPVPELNCEDELKKQLLSLLKEDKQNILGKQFQKTSLKLALNLINNRSNKNIKTLEDFISRDQQKLISSDNQNVLAKMMKFYQEHGKIEDANFIKNQFGDVKEASYWNKEKRLSNENISAYLLAESLSNDKSSFSEVDAATVWFAHQANSVFEKGTAEANLTNMSALVYRQVGLLKRDLPVKVKKLEEVISGIDSELDLALTSLKEKVEKNLSQCIVNGVFNGSQCWSQATFDSGLAQTIMGLNAQIINDKDFQISMDNKLKGEISGNFKFDFFPR